MPARRPGSAGSTRLVGDLPGTSPAQGLSVGSTAMPTSLYGPEPVMAVTDLRRVQVSGAEENIDPNGTRRRSLETLWSTDSSELGTGVRSALAASIDLLPSLDQPDTAGAYPATDLGKALAAVSRVLRADTGTSLVTVDQEDWDHHVDVGTIAYGRMRNNAANLASSIAAFFTDLGPYADKVTLVTISEFGRRIVENAQRGLDHGWGNVMFLAGAGVKGGQYYARWPGLDLSLDADLPVTTDYRSVLAEVVAARTDASVATVFPGLVPEAVGVMQVPSPDRPATGPSPAELAQPRVADPEVVAHLVHHRAAYLLDDRGLVPADRADGPAVNGDPVGQDAAVRRPAPGQRNAPVEPEQAGRAAVEVDRDGHVAHDLAQLRGQRVECLAHHRLEPLVLDLHHASSVRPGSSSPILVTAASAGPMTLAARPRGRRPLVVRGGEA